MVHTRLAVSTLSVSRRKDNYTTVTQRSQQGTLGADHQCFLFSELKNIFFGYFDPQKTVGPDIIEFR